MSATRVDGYGWSLGAATLNFSWDGTRYQGREGDTLASALLVNNVGPIGRSFKYHRPRGITSAGVEESGALVTVGQGDRRDPNVRATTQTLYEGLQAYGQNAWPNVRYDAGAINNVMGRFFAAGFYYKTFFGLPPFDTGSGTGVWMKYESLIRKAAGMGSASTAPDPDHYEHAHGFCDVLVVGSGPAGRRAASVAVQSGLNVWLVEQDSAFGGTDLSATDNRQQLIGQSIAELEAAGVTLLKRTTAFGLYDNAVAGLLERVTDHEADPSPWLPRQRFWTVRATRIILATGALERGYAFAHNDRPGVMTPSAAATYLNRYGVLAGQTICIGTNNDSAYRTATDLAKAGAVVTLLDARTRLQHPQLSDAAKAAGVNVRLRSLPGKALGRCSVTGVKTAVLAGREWRAQSRIACDALLVSGGWSPVVHLLSHRGVRPVWNETLQAFLPGETSEPISVCGSAAGYWSEQQCLDSGEAAAHDAVDAMAGVTGTATISVPLGWDNPIAPLYALNIDTRSGQTKAFVDLQHDVTSSDIALAHREGFVSVEHMKRYTTLGMANDQGKNGNVIGLALLADALGTAIDSVGTTTFRPPYTPVAIGALAGPHKGSHFRPLRRTPLHAWNLAAGGTLIEAGLWQRPWYFKQTNESLEETYSREARVTRQRVGLCDVTSLGKIAVQGPDAAEFLDRVYTNPFKTLQPGRARYGIMLRDDGMVFDDGTTWCLSPTDYFMTTTTAHAGAVLQRLEELLQVRWPELRVHVSSVTDQWAGVSVAGPLARQVLEQCVADAETVSDAALPFMGVIDTELQHAIPARIARISFSGELGYEVYTPSGFGPEMMTQLWTEAQAVGGCLYGLEALNTLRIEKGHVTGAELDGNITLQDAGLGNMGASSKAYVGSVLKDRPELRREDRPSLVGLSPVNTSERFNAGSLLYAPDKVGGHPIGWVTGVTFSPQYDHWIGIGYIEGGATAWPTTDIVCTDPIRGAQTTVRVSTAHRYDPEGARVRG